MIGAVSTTLAALLIGSDGGLLDEFATAIGEVPEVRLGGRLAEYPSAGELRERVDRANPDIVFIDIGTRPEQALTLLGQIVDYWPGVSAAAICSRNDPDLILRCLRSGAAEFFSSPFPVNDIRQAVQRMLSRRVTETADQTPRRGQVLVFAPAKGGSGATTLAGTVACHIAKNNDHRVLLVDLDLTTGLLSFLFRSNHPYSVADALQHSDQLDSSLWGSLISEPHGIHLLAAPEKPEVSLNDTLPVQEVLEFARSAYDYVVVDLGGVWEVPSLATLPLATAIYLVCSADMPSLYLMRRSILMLEESGYSREQLRILVNRIEKRSELTLADMEKIFRASVDATFPDDPQAVHRALRDGAMLADNSPLGKSIAQFSKRFSSVEHGTAKPQGMRTLKELLGGA